MYESYILMEWDYILIHQHDIVIRNAWKNSSAWKIIYMENKHVCVLSVLIVIVGVIHYCVFLMLQYTARIYCNCNCWGDKLLCISDAEIHSKNIFIVYLPQTQNV